MQCEKCDTFFSAGDAEQQPDGQYECNDGVTRSFCCDACFAESEEDYHIGQIEASREFELYGDDYDSWYR